MITTVTIIGAGKVGRSIEEWLRSDGSTEVPNDGSTESPKYGSTEVPNDGSTELPKYGSTEVPNDGSTEVPKYGSTEVPNDGSTELPKYGSTEVPKYGSTELPKYGSTEVPNDGSTEAVRIVSAREWISSRHSVIRSFRHSVIPSFRHSVIPSFDHSVIVLSCRDSQLPALVALLAEQHAEALSGALVLHVNGSLGTDILRPLQEHGAMVAAAHPFQTFAKADSTLLRGIGWGVECEEDAWERTAGFVRMIGGLPSRLPKTDAVSKRRYHAAAVAASNFPYAAFDLARRLAEDAGLPLDAFLAPIMRQTVENAIESIRQGTPFPITGPLVRGDMDAVQRQREAMPDDLREQYVHLMEALARAIGS